MDNNCVFCDRTQFEERLVGETKEFWIIATLGQISNGGYTLLVPKRHVECIGAMDRSEIVLLDRVAEKIFNAILKEYEAVMMTIVEHGIVGQSIKHAHLHFVPELCNLTEKVRSDFPGSTISKVNFWSELQGLYQRKPEPYLFWIDSSLIANACWNPQNVPMQYMRTIIAEAVGRPERANWRSMDPDLDKKLWSETVKRLKPYFLPLPTLPL